MEGNEQRQSETSLTARSSPASGSAQSARQQLPPLFQDSGQDEKRRPQRTYRRGAEESFAKVILSKTTKSTAEERQRKVRERNKRAQQRFRDRQKAKLDTTLVQIDGLMEQVTEANLRRKEAEEHSELLEEQVKAAEKRCRELERMLAEAGISKKEGEAKRPPFMFEPRYGFTQLPEDNFVMVLSASQKTPMHIRKEDLDKEPMSWHIMIWRTFVEAIAVALVASRGDVDSDACRQMGEIVNEMLAFCMWSRSVNPAVRIGLATVKLDETTSLPQPNDVQQLNMLKQIGLTKEQKQHLLDARRFCLETLADLKQERVSMSRTLQEISSLEQGWADMYSSHLGMIKLSERMAKSIHKEGAAFFSFLNSVGRRVLNPIQLASIIVQNYPYMLNLMSILSVLAKDAGEPVEQQLRDLTLPPQDPAKSKEGNSRSCSEAMTIAVDRLWDDIFLV